MKSIKLFPALVGILGIILFSSKAVMVKLAYQYEVSSINLLVFRMLFSLPFYIAVLFFLKRTSQYKPTAKDNLWLVFFGVIGYYLASYFDFVGLQYIKASIERVILFTYPTIVLLLSAIFLKRKITQRQVVAVVLTYIGVLIAFYEDFSIDGNQALIGMGFIVLSAITYASYLVGSDWLIPRYGVMRFTSYAMIVSCACVLIHYLMYENTSLLGYHPNVYWLGLAMAFFATVIPSYLVSYSIGKITASNFSILAGLGPISTIILASIFLDEHLTWLQLMATGIVILGILIISIEKNKKPSES